MNKTQPTLFFSTPHEWNDWLDENHQTSDGLWLKFAKKASGIPSVTPSEVLEVALCYGWIDGQRKKFDDYYYLNKYTPRRSRSLWSKRNCDIALRLIEEGKMQPAGFAEIERAKADGRWEKAYDSPANMEMPEDFLNELAKNPKAETCLAASNSQKTGNP